MMEKDNKEYAMIELHILPGEDIKDVFERAIVIASKTNMRCKFRFNGVDCYADADSIAKKGVKEYFDALLNMPTGKRKAFA